MLGRVQRWRVNRCTTSSEHCRRRSTSDATFNSMGLQKKILKDKGEDRSQARSPTKSHMVTSWHPMLPHVFGSLFKRLPRHSPKRVTGEQAHCLPSSRPSRGCLHLPARRFPPSPTMRRRESQTTIAQSLLPLKGESAIEGHTIPLHFPRPDHPFTAARDSPSFWIARLGHQRGPTDTGPRDAPQRRHSLIAGFPLMADSSTAAATLL